MHLAARFGHVSYAKRLLDKGANKEAVDNYRWALHVEGRFGHVSLAEMLLDKGANIEAVDNKGWTPLHWAANPALLI